MLNKHLAMVYANKRFWECAWRKPIWKFGTNPVEMARNAQDTALLEPLMLSRAGVFKLGSNFVNMSCHGFLFKKVSCCFHYRGHFESDQPKACCQVDSGGFSSHSCYHFVMEWHNGEQLLLRKGHLGYTARDIMLFVPMPREWFSVYCMFNFNLKIPCLWSNTWSLLIKVEVKTLWHGISKHEPTLQYITKSL